MQQSIGDAVSVALALQGREPDSYRAFINKIPGDLLFLSPQRNI